ncbi:integral membrane protein [Phlyctema vagabunda]|uniref:Integral membrane protein n=1 Tax=Phlyctema vagabunda TaxID=108571 RepID=A0ABR4PBR2_9HELO
MYFHSPSFTCWTDTAKLFYVGEIVYYVCVAFTKFSLLTLYLRFFTTKKLRMTAYATMLFVTLTGISIIIVIVFQCKPIPYAWNKAITGGKCVNVTAVFYSHAAINILTDFVIYIMPMKVLWGIARPRNEKIGLVVVFAIGFFVCLAGIIRLWALQKTSVSVDSSWDNEPAAVWSIIECCVGVICASVPSLKPLFSKVRKITNNSSFKLSDNDRENSKLSAKRGMTPDLDNPTNKWNMELSDRGNGRGTANSPTSSERNLVHADAHTAYEDSKSGIYKSTQIQISYAEGKMPGRV